MGIFSSFKKKQKDQTNDSNYIETIIKHSKDDPLAVSDENIIYAGYNELGGYYYLQTYIIGKLKVKTKTGGTLLIEGKGYTFDLKSDMDEFESDHMDVTGGYVTRIDFEIEKDTVNKIKRSTIQNITLKVKKNTVVFSAYENTSDKK